MNHRFLIITPTIQRYSLLETCESINRQTYTNWIHHVAFDCTMENFDRELANKIKHSHRCISICEVNHRNGGNTCRHNVCNYYAADWVIYCDDDNFLSDENILQDIASVLEPLPSTTKWAIFPITRLGGKFYTDPPRSCHIDTLNLVLRREVAQWPDTDAYGSDGILVDALMEREIPYAAFPDFRPIGVIPKISGGY